MDRTGANFERTVEMIVDRLQATPLVLQLPWGTESDFHGVIDLVQMNAHYWEGEMGEEWHDTDIPEEYREAAESARHQLFEKLADHDESVMEKFVHEEEPTTEELHRAIRRATLAGLGVPVLCRFRLQEQGCPAAARRDRRLPPVPGRGAARAGSSAQRRSGPRRAKA